MPEEQAGVAVAVALVVARCVLHLTALMLVVQGTSEPKLCWLLEDESGFQSQFSPTAERLDSSSRDARPSLPWVTQVHFVCPTSQMVKCFVSVLTRSKRLFPSTDKDRLCGSCRDISARCVHHMCLDAIRLELRWKPRPTPK
jgi:hypothetical protein